MEILLKILEETVLPLRLSVLRAPIQNQKDIGGEIFNKCWASGWSLDGETVNRL